MFHIGNVLAGATEKLGHALFLTLLLLLPFLPYPLLLPILSSSDHTKDENEEKLANLIFRKKNIEVHEA